VRADSGLQACSPISIEPRRMPQLPIFRSHIPLLQLCRLSTIPQPPSSPTDRTADNEVTSFRMQVAHSQRGRQADNSISRLTTLLHTLWGFMKNDIFTFAVPNSLFGIFGAMAYSQLVEGPPPLLIEILTRIPSVCFFNFYSLLIFNLANQRSPESVEEDRINKPWRPIPSGQITPNQTRKAALFTASASLGFNYLLNVWEEGLLVQVLSYYYNELKGGDWLSRDVIIAVSYGLANRTSLKLAIGPHNTISQQGDVWIVVISTVILTTMHIQDLQDQEGDRKLGRKTLPLVLGDRVCRSALAVLVPFWSCFSIFFWNLSLIPALLPCILGTLVATRVVVRREQHQDTRTWKLWCSWHASLYILPLLSNAGQSDLV
jgi:4-hydroxybenzoate polyprenyltransferase